MGKVACIVQARIGSTRLPGKVLKTLNGIPMLTHVIERLKQAKSIDHIIIATTYMESDKCIVGLAEKNDVLCYVGSPEDVLSRYAGAAGTVDADIIIRVTSDCPLIDPITIDNTVKFFEEHEYDYVRAGVVSGFPRGLDTEVFTREALMKAHAAATYASR